MSKKIAVVTATFPPYKGGMGNVACNFSHILSERDYKVRVFTPKYWKFREDENIPFTVKYLRPLLKYGNAGFVPQLFFHLLSTSTIHLHFPFYGGAEVVLLKKILFPKTKLILQYHFDTVGTGITRYIFKVYKILLYKSYFKRADAIIFTSEDYRKYSHVYDLSEKYQDKVTIVPNGVQYTHFAFPRNTALLRQKLGIEQRSFVALFVGCLDQAHYFKGLDVLFEAISIISRNMSKPFHLVIVGAGDMLSHYHEKARSLEIDTLVHFVGRVSDEELPQYYQLADITILPSIDSSEAFGLVLIESMAAGTPVLATRLPGVRDVVPENAGFLVSPNNEQELAKKLFYTYEHVTELRATHDTVQLHAKQFDWKAVTTKLEEVL